MAHDDLTQGAQPAPTPPNWQRFSTAQLRRQERFAAWRAALDDSHLRWSLDGHEGAEGSFSAAIDSALLPGMRLLRCRCAPCSGARGKREIAADTEANFGLLVVYSGHEEIAIADRRCSLGPGDMLLWDSTLPIRFRLRSPIDKATLLVPQARLREALPQARRLVGRAIDWRRGLGAVAASHLATVGAEVPHIDAGQLRAVAETTLALIASSLGAAEAAPGDAPRAALLVKIKAFIEDNLEDPSLGPRDLAQRFGISLRYLHQLFAHEELTVSRWVQQRRLERCRRELAAAGRHRNITELALAWGFADGAHFSRVFKRRYGLSPREYRKRA